MSSERRARAFRTGRDFLLDNDGDDAREGFRWPELDDFNWALDWFDHIEPTRTALHIVEEDGTERRWTFAELRARSNQVANWLRGLGVKRGDAVIVMLGNRVELWETLLAAMKLGALLIPSTTLLGPAEVRDRVERGRARFVVASADVVAKIDAVESARDITRVCVGDAPAPAGWHAYKDADGAAADFAADGVTRASDPLLLYFTSGTTALPKLVEHTHQSYPVGHLSTMFWIGLRPGDVHMNISSAGWAKHAWSCVFAPWNAEATVLVYNYARFDAAALLTVMERCAATTFCAPPTVWRMLVQTDLAGRQGKLREVVGAGEPLNPEVIEQVRRAWGLTVRDGYGQTETTAQIGNPPGQLLKPGSMGKPLPGYAIALVDPITGKAGKDGEICLPLDARPLGLMTGYRGDEAKHAEAMAGGYYHTGDVASVDDDGYITYVGRADDVFKASDYRISPFELESVLIEHAAVAEAAVVPSPDPLRLAVPKAFVTLAAGHAPNADSALAIFRHARDALPPYKRIRRLQFGVLPKTISGKIRRVELRENEAKAHASGARPDGEFSVDDFPTLKDGGG